MRVALLLIPALLLVPALPDLGGGSGDAYPTPRETSTADSILAAPLAWPDAPSLRHVGSTADFGSTADGGPALVEIDELTNLFGSVRFNHAAHAAMSWLEDGCASCHHQQTLVDAPVLPCRACHAGTNGSSTFELPGLKAAYHRQCLACHRDWSGENACGSCHEERVSGADAVPRPHDPGDFFDIRHPRLDGRPTFVLETSHIDGRFVTFNHDDHVERFGLGCVDCHRESSCGSCHRPASPADPAPISRHDRCFSCHGETRCGLCHDQTPRPRFDHEARSGWTLGTYHASSSCADCHGPTREFTVPIDRGCGSCHARPNSPDFDHGATGVPLAGSHASFECARCHDALRPEAAPKCGGCHPDRRYPEQWPGLATPPTTPAPWAERDAAPMT